MGFLGAQLFHKDKDYTKIAINQEKGRQAAITQGTGDINKAYGGFGQDFYNQRAQAYQDYALPQLAQQYQQARNQVGFGLANRGLLHSGAAQTQWQGLNRQMSEGRQNIADIGLGQAQALQRQIEASKDTQLGFLYQSADPSKAGAQAIASAASFSQPSVYAPLANQFSGLLNQYYLSQLINSYKPSSFVQQPTDTTNFAGALPKT
jgi:hypothetical protein